MIPKIIHYCWFGGNELPEKVRCCIDSWRRCCPDYEIIQWDESNYDVTKNEYMHQAYLHKKWAFVSDFARLDIIFREGGIYLDTDVETVRSFDHLLNAEAFFGFEKITGAFWANTGLGFGAEKGAEILQMLLKQYEGRQFVSSNGNLDMTPCPIINKEVFSAFGVRLDNSLQTVKNVLFLPTEYLGAYDYDTNEINRTENTVSIHYYAKTWSSGKTDGTGTLKHFLYRCRAKVRRLL